MEIYCPEDGEEDDTVNEMTVKIRKTVKITTEHR